MYRAILGNILLLVVFLMMFSCQGDKKSVGSNEIPQLNLTKNALWDKPALKEAERDSLYKMMRKEYSPQLVDFFAKMTSGQVTLKEVQLVHDSLVNSKSVYAGYGRLLTLNYILINTPVEDFTKNFVLQCLDEGYRIAEGSAPVPQSLFFNYWDNCMVGLSNTSAYDDVSKEAEKLLEICEQQKLLMGVMFSYRSLAGTLQDHFDYSTAVKEYEKADVVAKLCLPELLGSDWLTVKGMEKNMVASDYMLCYVDMISNQLFCCVNDSNFDWIKKNESEINQILKASYKAPSVHVCILYNMARYYDSMGMEKQFENNIVMAQQYRTERKVAPGTFLEFMFDYNHYQTMALHELKLNHVEKALAYMDKIDRRWLTVQNDETYAHIYMKMGRYKEAAEKFLEIVEHNKKDLDSRNRLTLTTLSSNIENKKRDIQMMQDEIESQHMQLVYNTIIIIFAFLLIIGLAFALYRHYVHNKRLAAALEKAEVANKAKNVFLGNMTHEISTPMNQIYGFAQLLSDRSQSFDEEDIRMMCDAICDGSEHLMKLTKNIVEVADKVSELDDLETVESIMKQ